MDTTEAARPSARLVADYLEHLAPGVHREEQVRTAMRAHGVSRTSVYDWLSGKKRPSAERLVEMARTLDRLQDLPQLLVA